MGMEPGMDCFGELVEDMGALDEAPASRTDDEDDANGWKEEDARSEEEVDGEIEPNETVV